MLLYVPEHIAKNYWVTLKCSVRYISLHLLVPVAIAVLEQFYSITTATIGRFSAFISTGTCSTVFAMSRDPRNTLQHRGDLQQPLLQVETSGRPSAATALSETSGRPSTVPASSGDLRETFSSPCFKWKPQGDLQQPLL